MNFWLASTYVKIVGLIMSPHIGGRFTVCQERRLERDDFLGGLFFLTL